MASLRESPGTTRQAWDSAGPGRAHQGLFTVRSASFRKPLCNIHLSLRNLDLQEAGGQQGQARHRLCPPEGHTSHRGPSTPPQAPQDQQGRREAGWSSRTARSQTSVALWAAGRWGIWSPRAPALRAQKTLTWNLCCRPPRGSSPAHQGQSFQTRPWRVPGTCPKTVDPGPTM